MKTTIITLLLALTLPVLSLAQESEAQKLYKMFSGQDGYTTVSISSWMLGMMGESDDPEFKEAIKGLTGIKILVMDDESPKAIKEFYTMMDMSLSSKGYEELMLITEGKDEVKFLIHTEADKIGELVLLVDEVMILIAGDIDLENISKLSNGMDIEGMEHLEEMKDQGKKSKATAH